MLCEEEIELRQEHILGARWVIAFAAGKIDHHARRWSIGKEEGERWLRMIRELGEGKAGRKPLLQEPERILSKWGLALDEQESGGKHTWQVEGYVHDLYALACLISSAHAAKGLKWTPPPLRLSVRLPERINDTSGLKRQKIVQEELEKMSKILGTRPSRLPPEENGLIDLGTRASWDVAVSVLAPKQRAAAIEAAFIRLMSH